jgi:hypothetical protein
MRTKSNCCAFDVCGREANFISDEERTGLACLSNYIA